MEVLIWHAKDEDVIYDASTNDKAFKAYGAIFKTMDENGDYECCPPETKQERELYRKAKAGDLNAARIFLVGRRDYEYENIEVKTVITA